MSRPNVILISIDTLRADHVSAYGYSRDTTPSLDGLAARGTRFSQAFTTAAWTPPAHGSMLTGLYPSQHRVVHQNRLHDSVPTIAEMLVSNGYRTLGLANNSQVGDLTGLDRGHAEFHEIWRGERATSFPGRVAGYLRRRMQDLRGQADHGAAKTTEIVKGWLDAHAGSGDPFYAFIHYIEPHNPLRAPEPFFRRYVDVDPGRIDQAKMELVADNPLVCFTDSLELNADEIRYLEALYDGEIAYLDQILGDLFRHLERIGHFDDTLIIVTADHGEHFGEHGLYSHVSSLYEPIVHVPMIVKFPAGHEQPRVRDELVQLTDILPTIAALAGVEAPHADRLLGRPLTAADGRVGHDHVFAEWEGRVPYYVQARTEGKPQASVCTRFQRPFSMVRDRRHKLLADTAGGRELYDLAEDPGETKDVAAERPQVVAALEQVLHEWKRRVEADAPEDIGYTLDPEVRRHLESLGYM